jgi:hypothetical protein
MNAASSVLPFVPSTSAATAGGDDNGETSNNNLNSNMEEEGTPHTNKHQ